MSVAPGTAPPVETSVGVLDRVVRVLDAVEAGATTFSEIARATALPRSTVHRLLRAMEAHGLVSEPLDGAYRIGPRLLRLASAAARDLPLRDLARPALVELAASTGESAQLFVRERDERICVVGAESDRELRTIVPVGSALPITAGSAGKVFMAWAPDRDRLVASARSITRATPTGDRLRRQVETVRTTGVATSVSERQEGVASVSAPVFSRSGELLAVVSISGPSARLGRDAATALGSRVRDAAHAIERALEGASGG